MIANIMTEINQQKICIEIFYRMKRSEMFNRFITTHTLVRLHSTRLYSDTFFVVVVVVPFVYMVIRFVIYLLHTKKMKR